MEKLKIKCEIDYILYYIIVNILKVKNVKY